MANDYASARVEWCTLRDEIRAIDSEIAAKGENDSDLPRLREARIEMRESMDAIKKRLNLAGLSDSDFDVRLRSATPPLRQQARG
jgi:hypothetical protein